MTYSKCPETITVKVAHKDRRFAKAVQWLRSLGEKARFDGESKLWTIEKDCADLLVEAKYDADFDIDEFLARKGVARVAD